MTETASEQVTCGKGLAANAALPGKLAELLAAQADVLERHMRAIDRADPNAAAELQAYTELSRGYRAASAELAGLSQQMSSYRELPMPSHDPNAFAGADGQMAAFRHFVDLEQELVAQLQQKLEVDRLYF